jgi:hypothetical protein
VSFQDIAAWDKLLYHAIFTAALFHPASIGYNEMERGRLVETGTDWSDGWIVQPYPFGACGSGKEGHGGSGT